jgi:hypothetical protein
VGAALFEPLPSQAHLEAHGLTREDYDDDATEVWPENFPALQIFRRVMSQWRVAGMGGYVGLDYTALYPVMAHMGLTGDAWLQMLDDIGAIEDGAKERLNKKQD